MSSSAGYITLVDRNFQFSGPLHSVGCWPPKCSRVVCSASPEEDAGADLERGKDNAVERFTMETACAVC